MSQHTELDFETHYSQVRAQHKVHKYELDEESINYYRDTGTSVYDLACVTAIDNDIESLRLIMSEPFFSQAKDAAARSVHGINALTYCVAHMLVDNGGNEAFAHEWLQKCGHTRSAAAEYFSALWGKDPDEKLPMQQRRLGVATLADVLQAGANPNGFALLYDAMMTSGIENRDMLQKVREGAFILRTCHPDELPTIAMAQDYGPAKMEPYSDHLWASKHRKSHHMLDAVNEAYAADNDAVREQVQSSLDKLLSSEDSLCQHDHTFSALKKWGREGYGRELWTQHREAWSFVDQIIHWEQPSALGRLQQLINAGADVNAPYRPAVSLEGTMWRAIDAAVHYAKPESVRFLLARGSDPDIPSKNTNPSASISAVELAARKESEDPGTAETPRADIEAVASIMRSHASMKAALAAIEEIDALIEQKTVAVNHPTAKAGGLKAKA